MSENESEVEETEPQAEAEDGPGVEGQIMYPEPNVDAERAAAFAAGKVDTLEPEDDEDEEPGSAEDEDEEAAEE
jgi:hypothetical protein